MCFHLVSMDLSVCIDVSIAKHDLLLLAALVLLDHLPPTPCSLLILAVDVLSRMIASDRAATRLFQWWMRTSHRRGAIGWSAMVVD